MDPFCLSRNICLPGVWFCPLGGGPVLLPVLSGWSNTVPAERIKHGQFPCDWGGTTARMKPGWSGSADWTNMFMWRWKLLQSGETVRFGPVCRAELQAVSEPLKPELQVQTSNIHRFLWQRLGPPGAGGAWRRWLTCRHEEAAMMIRTPTEPEAGPGSGSAPS